MELFSGVGGAEDPRDDKQGQILHASLAPPMFEAREALSPGKQNDSASSDWHLRDYTLESDKLEGRALIAVGRSGQS